MIELIRQLIKPGPAVKLTQQIEGLLRDGRIPPEAVLPPVREVARAIGVSPGTAAAAYKALRAQGLVTTDGRRGTRVLPRPAQREYLEVAAPPGTVDLQVADPDPRLLPDLQRIFASIETKSHAYGGSHVDEGLLKRMRADFEADGVDASHAIATSGAIAAIYRALHACAAAGEKVAVEDPGFNEHHASVRAQSMIPVPVSLDEQGMLPESLAAALRGGARAVILTPRFQNPTGAALSKARAAQLREVLARYPDVAVLIDDYASLLSDRPYHHCIARGRSRFLVVRSFNKVVAPDLRVAMAAADAETADRLRREQWLVDGWVSVYLQRAAAAVLESRSAQAVIARARRTYAARRSELISALRERGIAAHGATGFNVWVPVTDEASAARCLLDRGWCVRPGARYRLRSPPAIRITIASLPAEQGRRLADDLSRVLCSGPVGRGP